MFTKFAEKNKDVVIRLLDFIALQLIVDCISWINHGHRKKLTGNTYLTCYRQINYLNYLLVISQGFVTSGIYIIQLSGINEECCDFLETQLDSTIYWSKCVS